MKNHINPGQITLTDEIIVENFAGGGGAATGIGLACGRVVDIAINHSADAILMHRTNHPHTTHYQTDVWDIDPVEVCAGRPVGLAWFSPDCTHFSRAKGGTPVEKKIRGLSWVVLRWCMTVEPRVIMMENVLEILTWGPLITGADGKQYPDPERRGETFKAFFGMLTDGVSPTDPGFLEGCEFLGIAPWSEEGKRLSKGLGYKAEYKELVAADYGAPTIRKRFLLIARRDGEPIVWPEQTHAPADSAEVKAGKKLPWRSAAGIIDWSLPCPSIFDTSAEIKAKYGLKARRPLKDNTMQRIAFGTDKFVLKSPRPFLIEINHDGKNFRGQELNEPLTTITAKLGRGMVKPTIAPWEVTNTTNSVGSPCNEPVHTVTTGGGGNQMLVAATMAKYYGNDQHGQGITSPLHTITAKDREALGLVSMQKFYGGVVGSEVSKPVPTITAIDHNAVQTVKVVRYEEGQDLGKWPQVRELLNTYCGYTLADNEIILLNIGGVWYFIADIGMRMLVPKELYRGNGFPEDYIIERDYLGNEYKPVKQVARCGNAVPPPFATALVRANFPEWCGEPIYTMAEYERRVAV